MRGKGAGERAKLSKRGDERGGEKRRGTRSLEIFHPFSLLSLLSPLPSSSTSPPARERRPSTRTSSPSSTRCSRPGECS